VPKPSDLLQGTLDLLILKTIASDPVHGWGIAKRIQLLSDEVLAVGQGSLYPALHRMTESDLLKAEWRMTDAGRRARFYQLTTKGRRRLAESEARWHDVTAAVAKVLRTAS
jgi:transcriptional regulator